MTKAISKNIPENTKRPARLYWEIMRATQIWRNDTTKSSDNKSHTTNFGHDFLVLDLLDNCCVGVLHNVLKLASEPALLVLRTVKRFYRQAATSTRLLPSLSLHSWRHKVVKVYFQTGEKCQFAHESALPRFWKSRIFHYLSCNIQINMQNQPHSLWSDFWVLSFVSNNLTTTRKPWMSAVRYIALVTTSKNSVEPTTWKKTALFLLRGSYIPAEEIGKPSGIFQNELRNSELRTTCLHNHVQYTDSFSSKFCKVCDVYDNSTINKIFLKAVNSSIWHSLQE